MLQQDPELGRSFITSKWWPDDCHWSFPTIRASGMGVDDAVAAFRALYPPYAPARGMADYVRLNWDRYQFGS